MTKISRRRLRVLMLPSDYPTEENPSASIFFREHARAVSLSGDVTIFFVYPASKEFMSKNKVVALQRNVEVGLNTIRIKFRQITPKINIIIAFLLSYIVLQKISKIYKFDVIHAQKLFPAGMLALVASRIWKIPFIVTEHSGNFPHAIRSMLRRYITAYVIKKTDYLIAVSKHLLTEIQQFVRKSQSIIIPNPVNTALFKKLHEKQRRKSIKKILHVSSLNKYKGIDNLIASVQQLRKTRKDFIFNIVGGNIDLVKKYQIQVKKYGLTKFIIFHGLRSHEEISTFMCNCDFFVLPSLTESFGIVLIEAMACGKPVIATICGGPEEIVMKETGLLIPPANVMHLAGSLNYMLDNYSKFDSAIIRKYIIENYSYYKIGSRIADIYELII